MNTKNPDLRFNRSGCLDTTSFEALTAIRREERRKLIAELKKVANQHGYRIVSTIMLRETDGDDHD